MDSELWGPFGFRVYLRLEVRAPKYGLLGLLGGF